MSRAQTAAPIAILQTPMNKADALGKEMSWVKRENQPVLLST